MQTYPEINKHPLSLWQAVTLISHMKVTMFRHYSVHSVCATVIWNEMKLSPEHKRVFDS